MYKVTVKVTGNHLCMTMMLLYVTHTNGIANHNVTNLGHLVNGNSILSNSYTGLLHIWEYFCCIYRMPFAVFKTNTKCGHWSFYNWLC